MKEKIGITEGLRHLDKVQTQVRRKLHDAPVKIESTPIRIQRPSPDEVRQWKQQAGIKYLGQK